MQMNIVLQARLQGTSFKIKRRNKPKKQEKEKTLARAWFHTEAHTEKTAGISHSPIEIKKKKTKKNEKKQKKNNTHTKMAEQKKRTPELEHNFQQE